MLTPCKNLTTYFLLTTLYNAVTHEVSAVCIDFLSLSPYLCHSFPFHFLAIHPFPPFPSRGSGRRVPVGGVPDYTEVNLGNLPCDLANSAAFWRRQICVSPVAAFVNIFVSVEGAWLATSSRPPPLKYVTGCEAINREADGRISLEKEWPTDLPIGGRPPEWHTGKGNSRECRLVDDEDARWLEDNDIMRSPLMPASAA